MKKSLIIVIGLCYFFVACGFTINQHYCGGKLKSVSFLKITEEGCCGEMEKSGGCCKTKSTFFKINDNHKLNVTRLVACKYVLISSILNQESFCLFTTKNSSFNLVYRPPPVLYSNPIYLRYQVLLI